MKFYNVVLFCLVLLVMSCNVWCADRIQDGDPGTIGAALIQSDGTQVTLESEQVIWRGRSGKSFAIKEYFETRPQQPRLVVISTRSLPVKDTYTVDVTGTLSTVAGTSEDGSPITQRVIIASPENIKVYCDSKGRPMIFPPVKSLGMTEWLHKKTLTELAGVSAENISAMDGGFPALGDPPIIESLPPAEGSRDSLKWIPDGSQVHLRNRLIVGRINSSFCIEEPDRTSSIRVGTTNYSADTGNLVDIVGTLTTNSGERYVQADTDGVTITESSCAIPRPFGMPNKSVGGGAVGMFTPGVGEAVGPNNTGMLATVWGTVTAADLYNSTGNYYYCIDDGSGVASEAYPTGIRVFGDWDYPYEGDYVIVTGVIHCDNGYASVTKLENTYPTYSSGSGTISGTITSGPSASGLTARIHSTCGSTTCLLNASGSGSYTLSAKPGNHTVSVDVAGYGHAAQKATVIDSQTTTKNFTLSPISKGIYVYPSSTRIAPDGVSTTTAIAVVYDEEGRRLPNQPVTWNIDLGTIVSSESLTNIIGEAACTVRSSTNHETATITAQTGSQLAYNWIEYGTINDPSILPEQPNLNQVLSGDYVPIQYWVSASDNTVTSLENVEIFIDDVSVDILEVNDAIYYWDTFAVANGWHSLRAKATDVYGNSLWSPVTWVYTDNLIHSASVTPDEIDPSLGEQASFHALLKEPCNWQATIKDATGSTTVYSTSGTGSEVNVTWDGATLLNEDLFQCTVSATATSSGQTCTTSERWVGKKIIPDSQVRVLAVAGPGLSATWPLHIDPIYSYAISRGFPAKKLYPKTATWNRVKSILQNGVCRMFYVAAHGYFQSRPALGGGVTYRTHFTLTPTTGVPGRVVSYPISGYPYQAVSSIGLENSSQMRFVMVDACYSGASGTTSGENDMAKAFGMYSSSNMSAGDQSYIGWRYSCSGTTLAAELKYTDYILELFYAFYPSGRVLYQAEWMAYYTDPSRFEYIYSQNLMNYGGYYNTAYYTTFFEVY